MGNGRLCVTIHTNPHTHTFLPSSLPIHTIITYRFPMRWTTASGGRLNPCATPAGATRSLVKTRDRSQVRLMSVCLCVCRCGISFDGRANSLLVLHPRYASIHLSHPIHHHQQQQHTVMNTAAALAAGSIAFRDVDHGYASLLLERAKMLYDFGERCPGDYIVDGTSLCCFSEWADDCVHTWLEKGCCTVHCSRMLNRQWTTNHNKQGPSPPPPTTTMADGTWTSRRSPRRGFIKRRVGGVG